MEPKEVISTNMSIPGGYFIPEVSEHALVSRGKAGRSRNFPCPSPGCCHLFSSQAEVARHVDLEEEHLLIPESSKSATASDLVKLSWLEGLEGKLERRKQGNLFLVL